MAVLAIDRHVSLMVGMHEFLLVGLEFMADITSHTISRDQRIRIRRMAGGARGRQGPVGLPVIRSRSIGEDHRLVVDTNGGISPVCFIICSRIPVNIVGIMH